MNLRAADSIYEQSRRAIIARYGLPPELRRGWRVRTPDGRRGVIVGFRPDTIVCDVNGDIVAYSPDALDYTRER